MSLQLTGRLYSGSAIEQKSENFKVRTFILEITETNNGNTYTNYAQFQLVNGQVELLSGFTKGQQVTVSFNVRGQFWQDKCITNLNAWKIEAVQQQAPAPQPQQQPAQHPQQSGLQTPWPNQQTQQLAQQWGQQPVAQPQQQEGGLPF